MRFAVAPCDATFFDTASERYRRVFDLPVPAERVWQELTADHPMAWCRALTSASWTSPRPFGVGTTRTVTALHTATLFERFFIWEEGRRYAFHAVEANVPVYRRVAEDYLLEPLGSGRCRFTWTVAVDAKPLARPLRPFNAALMRSIYRDTSRHFS